MLGVPRAVLPEVRSSSEVYGADGAGSVRRADPIAGIAGDQQAALFGQNCFTRGLAKNTYGTGCFMLMNIGAEPAPSQHSCSRRSRGSCGGQTEYALEGSVFIGGAVVQWLRDGLGIIKSSAEIEAARGERAGLRRRVSRAGLCGARRAALGSICAGHDRRADARHDRRPSRARRARRASPSRSRTCSK